MSRTKSLAACAAVIFTVLVQSRSAHACGGSGPGGTGVCDLSAGPLPKPRLGASFLTTETTILFGKGRRAEATRDAAFVSASFPLSPRLSLDASIGALLGGDLVTPAARVTLGPGVASALGLQWKVVDGAGARPLVLLGIAASSTATATSDPKRPYSAYDVRASAVVGKMIARAFTPYLLTRAFGGPAFYRWDDGSRVTGTDLYKYQVGGGLSFRIALFDVFAEITPLGERGAAFGAGWRW